jgi:NAD(P)-dependent dehydrogenase (short-subunit alcohol dehydrogenase family)
MTDTAPSQKASELAAKYADSVRGKVVLTTGASPTSIGKGFVEALAAHQPGLLIIAGRNDERNQEVVDGLKAKFPEVKARTLKLNLLSLKAVREAAEQVHQWEDVPQIDVLALSAGIMAPGWAKSEDGFESQFATNHLGHFLFTNLIIEKVLKAPNPRVVVVSSDGHRLNPIRFDDYNFHEGESYDKWTAYGQSKTANNLFAVSLAQKLGKSKNLKAYPINPGVVLSNLAGHLDFEKDFADMRTNLQPFPEKTHANQMTQGFLTRPWATPMPGGHLSTLSRPTRVPPPTCMPRSPPRLPVGPKSHSQRRHTDQLYSRQKWRLLDGVSHCRPLEGRHAQAVGYRPGRGGASLEAQREACGSGV